MVYSLFKCACSRERCRKTKTTKLIAGGIGSTWVQLERVNPSPSPTHSARESEWAKVEDVLKATTRCSRKTESIRVTYGLVDFGMLVLGVDYSVVRYYTLGMGRKKNVQQFGDCWGIDGMVLPVGK
ncbi:hypothetical protein H5410_030860 [Solanum commersonii]|uniref:Uncharacterized protein n=1 Tax=Solanum commersonii TaxID=4109 RepID=A0A9J5YGS9_SOLCO|nr:hypothetical protein H5410_030860 [Solanum commersonii]